ncbi:MAG: hypothetical protein QQN41_04700 [Nitrosopumilus sp.]
MKPDLHCVHCGKIFENLRLLNNHYNQLGVDYFGAIFREFEEK